MGVGDVNVCPDFTDQGNGFFFSYQDGSQALDLTGLRDADRVQSGFSTRPQIVFSRHADRLRTMRNLIAGLLHEAESAKLIDVFLWSDMAGLVDARFHRRP